MKRPALLVLVPVLAALGLAGCLMLRECGRHSAVDSMQTQDEYTLRKKQRIELGRFDVESGRLLASDPGYTNDPRYDNKRIATVEKCLNGEWRAELVVKTFASGEYTNLEFQAEILVVHESVADGAVLVWRLAAPDVGVDTGTAGIWDAKHFHDQTVVPKDIRWTSPKEKPAPSDPSDLWVSWAFELAGNGPQWAGVMAYGVVSHAGKGDGGYPLYVARDANGNVVAAKIIVIGDDGHG